MKHYRSLAILAVFGLGMIATEFAAAQSTPGSGDKMSPTQTSVQTSVQSAGTAPHDFDFLIGHWQVHHRRLKERLANSHEWIEFEGSAVTQKIMGGYGTLDDNVLDLPEGAYHGVGLRSFDPKSGLWSIWWLDSRTPLGPLDPPVRGGFRDGTGTFFADETFNGRPIRVRFVWSQITPASCHWEQAFSPDGGATWETNWAMDFKRLQ